MTSAPVRELITGLRDFLLPAACAVCRDPLGCQDDGLICRVCWSRAVPLVEPTCDRCGHSRLSPSLPRAPRAPREIGSALDGSAGGAPEDDALPPCRWCTRLPPFVRAARSWCRMDTGSGAGMVHALKYGGWPAVAPAMAGRMARLRFPADVIEERTALVAVPLSYTRRRERGYNQAEELARALAVCWRVPLWSDAVVRTRDTRSQVRLTPAERTRNVSNAFAVAPSRARSLRGAHVVLVDDVITTAATLNAAAAALADGGARLLSYVSFGRAPEPGERSDFDLDEQQDLP